MNPELRDLRKLATGLTVLVVLGAAAAAAGWWAVGETGRAEKAAVAAQARYAEAERRLREVSSEEEEIRRKAALFRELASRRIIGPEQRLEWVETIEAVRRARRLFDIDYEFLPQQTLAGGGAPYRFGTSTMSFRLPLLHEGDLFHFLEDLQGRAPALIQPRHCTLERNPGAGSSNLVPQLTAQCTLQWITLGDEAPGSRR
jgi:hypothetical protein